jgi:hypothetical protein
VDAVDIARRPGVIPIGDFERLVDRVRPHFPRGASLAPGTQFGPLRGTFGFVPDCDFLWVNPWTPLLRAARFDALAERAPRLVAVPLEVDDLAPEDGLVELSIPPATRLAEPDAAPACARCGRRETSLPDGPHVTAAAYDPPLARLREWPTMIVATPVFVAAVRDLGLTGARLREIPAA